jgi:hypothetical protein
MTTGPGSNGRDGGDNLQTAAINWLTPSASEDAAGTVNGKMQRMLTQQAKEWSTPRASDAEKGGPNQSFGAGGIPLPAQAAQWATPTSVHRKSEKAMRPFALGGSSSPPGIEQQAEGLVCSLQAQPTATDGEKSSPDRRSLNPLFVEWLMGWPPGWTLLSAGHELTAFASSATALSAWKQRMRSALLSLGLPREAPPAQLALFG